MCSFVRLGSSYGITINYIDVQEGIYKHVTTTVYLTGNSKLSFSWRKRKDKTV